MITRWSDWYQAPDEHWDYGPGVASGPAHGLVGWVASGGANGVSTSGVFGDGVPAVTQDYMFAQNRLGNLVTGDTWSSFLGTPVQVLPGDMVTTESRVWDDFGGWGGGSTGGIAGSRTQYSMGTFPFGDPSVLHGCSTEVFATQGWFYPGYDIGRVGERLGNAFDIINPLLGPDEYIIDFESAQSVWVGGASHPSAAWISSELDFVIEGQPGNTSSFTAEIRAYNPAAFAISPFSPFFDHQTFLHNHAGPVASLSVSPSTSEIVTVGITGVPTTAPELPPAWIPGFPQEADFYDWLLDPAHNYSRALSVQHSGVMSGTWDYYATATDQLNQQLVGALLWASRTVLRPSPVRFLIARDCAQSRLHYRTNQNPLEGGRWRSVSDEGVRLMYNDPITQSWQPVCSAESPIYANINGQWVPLCCRAEDYTSPFS